MDGREFARQLGAWIRPGVIAQVVGEFRDDPKASQETVRRYLYSGVLGSADEAGFADLVQLYLNNFFVPPSILTVAQIFWNSYFQDAAIVAKVREAPFQGSLHRDFSHAPASPGRTGKALLMVESSCFESRLVAGPLDMLNGLVSNLAKAIREVPNQINNLGDVHQELTHDSPLATFVESRVGQHYGLRRFGRAGMKEKTIQIRSTPRYKSFYGPGPVSESVLLDAIKLLSDLKEEPMLPQFPREEERHDA